MPAFFIPVAPPTPPSASAEIALAEARDESFLVALKKVYKNTQFWVLFAAFSISVGVFNTITSLINQIVVPYGYSDDDAGLFGASFILVGKGSNFKLISNADELYENDLYLPKSTQVSLELQLPVFL